MIATGGNVAILEVWNGSDERKLQSSILQALHGFYAVGGVLSSPIARPFLGVFEQPVETNVTIGGDCKSLGCLYYLYIIHKNLFCFKITAKSYPYMVINIIPT